MGFYKLTLEEIESALKKAMQAYNQQRYGDRLVFGFIVAPSEGNKTVWVTQDTSLYQDGKPVVLMLAGGEVHKAVLKAEEEYGIHCGRLNKETMEKIHRRLHWFFTDEDGNPISIDPYIPPFVPYLTPPELSNEDIFRMRELMYTPFFPNCMS